MVENNYIIFDTLWYTIQEMNNDIAHNNKDQMSAYYSIISVNIDEENQCGEAIIRNHLKYIDDEWNWDNDLDIWIRKE